MKRINEKMKNEIVKIMNMIIMKQWKWKIISMKWNGVVMWK